jgi:hypothetical protein
MRTRFTLHLIVLLARWFVPRRAARVLFPHLNFQPFIQVGQAETQTASGWADWGKRGMGGLYVFDSGGIWISRDSYACLVPVITYQAYYFFLCLLIRNHSGSWLRARLGPVAISFGRSSFLVGLEPPALTCLSGPHCFNLLTFVDYYSASSPRSYLLF